MASNEPACDVLDRAYPEWRFASAGYEAVITAVGPPSGTSPTVGVTWSCPSISTKSGRSTGGAVLAPWPNRIGNGKYVHQGRHFQLPINEVECGHALHGHTLHGLVHWARWEPVATTPSSVTLRHTLVPQDGCPFALQLLAEYQLGSGGLTGRLSTTNIGLGAAPYGCCPHPYLVAGSGALDSWRLTMPAARRLEIDDRLLPRDLVPVTAVDSDFRSPAAIGPTGSITPSPIWAGRSTAGSPLRCGMPRTTPVSNCPGGRGPTGCRSTPLIPPNDGFTGSDWRSSR